MVRTFLGLGCAGCRPVDPPATKPFRVCVATTDRYDRDGDGCWSKTYARPTRHVG
jgi:hypothetical protein